MEGVIVSILGAILKSSITWIVAGIAGIGGGIALYYHKYQDAKVRKERDELKYELKLREKEDEVKEIIDMDDDDIDPFAPLK